MMSSDSGFFATPFVGPYCSSKFALEGYSDSLRREIIPHGMKVILIEPGRIKTPIWHKVEDIMKTENMSSRSSGTKPKPWESIPSAKEKPADCLRLKSPKLFMPP